MLGVPATTNSLACCTKTAMQHIPQHQNQQQQQQRKLLTHFCVGVEGYGAWVVMKSHSLDTRPLDTDSNPARTRPKGLTKPNRIVGRIAQLDAIFFHNQFLPFFRNSIFSVWHAFFFWPATVFDMRVLRAFKQNGHCKVPRARYQTHTNPSRVCLEGFMHMAGMWKIPLGSFLCLHTFACLSPAPSPSPSPAR